MEEKLARRHIVLLGIGHTNAHVVRMWGMNAIPDTDLTCISNFGVATYSGMLPAVLAGQNTTEEMEIDLVKLCSVVGARLILNQVTGLDHDKNEVLFADRPAVPYDALSIGIGSVPSIADVAIEGESMIKIKPMQTFLDRLGKKYLALCDLKQNKPVKVAVVGGGVAGVEVAFCLPAFLEGLTQRPFEISLLTRGEDILPGALASTRQRTLAEFARRKVTVRPRSSVKKVTQDHLQLVDETKIPADLVIWATGASAPEFLQQLDLPTDDRGFLAVDDCLQTTSGRPVFAVGDTGTMVNHRLPKAGVYAVRQGPVLWENLSRILDQRTLKSYVPQPSFLSLINKGDGTAIGQWKGKSFEGKWVMRLKDRIDGKFMKMFRVKPMDADGEMQCKGCGCKLAARDLDSVVGSIDGIEAEDAAEIGLNSGDRIVASTDFFTSPFTDAYLSGRVAALHSASDILCSGAQVNSALANVVLPEGDSDSQQRILGDFLEGARQEFDAMGAKIVGGHTIVGPRMEAGFTVIGQSASPDLIRKRNLKLGDVLFVTKPLGIGMLLAAHMRGRCSALGYTSVIQTMLERQHQLAKIAVDFGITAGTDITGFGLAGHLLEMLNTSDVSATIDLSMIDLIPGINEALENGIESTLAPSNRKSVRNIKSALAAQEHSVYPVLFDPQTCGGFLFGTHESIAEKFQSAALDAGFTINAIGHVTPKQEVAQLTVEC